MSEIPLKSVNALIVSEVEAGTAADRAGIRTGDLLREINGKPILDILDYRFHSADERLRLTVERDGRVLRPILRKEEAEDAGLAFEFDLGDKIHTCKNKCVFCFIHQQPKKMRKSLYLMDDDFRLSFMHGNYVTLTNLSDAEWARILDQRLSPLYVSVHATDPDLRAVMLGRREPAPILPQIRELADNGIDVHAQIVLCPGLNDGENLERTLDDLALEHRSVTGKRAGVPSVAIVPVGMTRFRERLPKLRHVERDYAREMISRVARRGREFERRLGSRFAWLADEWYYIAGVSYPGKAHYEEFPQLEDGIGTVRLFLEDARLIERSLPARSEAQVSATLVTAEMPAAAVRRLADRLNRIEGVDLNVCVVKNDFFGADIHIAGLLTAQDILAHLRRFAEVKRTVFLPQICLRDRTLFLDDVTIDDARAESGLDLRVVGNRPRDLAEALGLLAPARRGRQASRAWMMEPGVSHVG
jgi:putative radical SAM enzyme (TIGR03279 family)